MVVINLFISNFEAMKKFVYYILLIILPILTLVILVNYFVDPSMLFHDDYYKNIIEGHKQGHNVTFTGSNMDERKYKILLAEEHKGDNLDYLIMGGSRQMTLSSDVFPEFKVLNMSVSSCKIEDLEGLYQLCNENNISYSNLILGVDPTYFNSSDDADNWKTLYEYYDAYKDENNKVDRFATKLNNLLSVSYFHSSMEELFKRIGGKEIHFEYVDTDVNENYTKRKDGSITYPKSYRERSQALIDKEALTWTYDGYKNYSQMSQEKIKHFEDFLNCVKKDGVTIIFFCCPMHPNFYNVHKNDLWMEECEKYIRSFANSQGITIVGHYNPSIDGFKNTDFYDAAHVRKESVDKLFQQMKNP